MGLPSLIGNLTGAGKVGGVNTGQVNNQSSQLFNQLLGSAGSIYNTQSQFQPQYTALDLSSLYQILNGNSKTPGYQDMTTSANTASRSANIADLLGMGQQAGQGVRATYDATNPAGSALQNQLTNTASQQMQQGSQMAPNDIYNVTKGVRSDWSNRGLGASAPAQLGEALNLATAGEGLRQQRQNFASGVAQQNQQGSQFQTALALPYTSGNSTAPQTAAALGAGASQPLNTSNQLASLMSQIYGAKNSNAQQTAGNNVSMWNAQTAGESSALGSL